MGLYRFVITDHWLHPYPHTDCCAVLCSLSLSLCLSLCLSLSLCVGVMVWPGSYGADDVEIPYNMSDTSCWTKKSNSLNHFLHRKY